MFYIILLVITDNKLDIYNCNKWIDKIAKLLLSCYACRYIGSQ